MYYSLQSKCAAASVKTVGLLNRSVNSVVTSNTTRIALSTIPCFQQTSERKSQRTISLSYLSWSACSLRCCKVKQPHAAIQHSAAKEMFCSCRRQYKQVYGEESGQYTLGACQDGTRSRSRGPGHTSRRIDQENIWI